VNVSHDKLTVVIFIHMTQKTGINVVQFIFNMG